MIIVDAESSISYSAKTSHSWTNGKEESKTRTFKFDAPITVPANSVYQS